jgi:hypothetical protein
VGFTVTPALGQGTTKTAPYHTEGSVLPFPPVPSASVAGETRQESKMILRQKLQHLPKNAPNIVTFAFNGKIDEVLVELR